MVEAARSRSAGIRDFVRSLRNSICQIGEIGSKTAVQVANQGTVALAMVTPPMSDRGLGRIDLFSTDALMAIAGGSVRLGRRDCPIDGGRTRGVNAPSG